MGYNCKIVYSLYCFSNVPIVCIQMNTAIIDKKNFFFKEISKRSTKRNLFME